MSKQPSILAQGKEFHTKVQEFWKKENQERDLKDRQEDVAAEKFLKSWKTGRSGRMDVYVTVEEADFFVSVVEIKNTDWDRFDQHALRRNIRRQIRQIERYIDVIHEEDEETGEKSQFWIAPGIVFPSKPRDPERLAFIEQLFDDHGINVVWFNESAEERKARDEAADLATAFSTDDLS